MTYTLNGLFNECKLKLEQRGFAVGAGSWIDNENERFYVSSKEVYPDTNGHPQAELSFNNNWLSGSRFYPKPVKFESDEGLYW